MISYIEVRAPYIQSVDVKNFIIIKIIFQRQDLHFVCYVNHKGLRNNHLLHEDCIFSSKRKKRYFKHDTIAIALDEYNVFCCCLKQKKTYLICPCPCDTVQWNYRSVFWRKSVKIDEKLQCATTFYDKLQVHTDLTQIDTI